MPQAIGPVFHAIFHRSGWFHTLVLMIGQVDKEIHMLVQINNECYMVGSGVSAIIWVYL
jgi:hypothetical protein